MGTIDGHRDLGVAQTGEEDLVTPRRAAESKYVYYSVSNIVL